MKGLNARGLKAANKMLLLAAVAYNLIKLMRWQGKNTNTMIKALQKAFLNLTETITCYYNLWKITGWDNRNYFFSLLL